MRCSSRAGSTSSQALSSSAARPKRPGKVRAGKTGINVLFCVVADTTFVSFQLHLLVVPPFLSFIQLFCFMQFHFIIGASFFLVLPGTVFCYCFFIAALILLALHHISLNNLYFFFFFISTFSIFHILLFYIFNSIRYFHN